MTDHDRAQEFGDPLVALVRDAVVLYQEFEEPALLVVDVDDRRLEAQAIAGVSHPVVLEPLLAVQHLRQLDAEVVEPAVRIRAVHLQAEEEGRRYREIGMAGAAGRLFIRIDEIGLADGLGEKTQAAALDVRGERRRGVADEFAIEHPGHPVEFRGIMTFIRARRSAVRGLSR